MKLSQQIKISKHIFRLLKVTEITYPIARTPKGNLGITFNDKNDDFEMMLDSVPLSTKNSLEDENNIELKKMLTKYLFEGEDIIKWPSTSFSENIAEDLIETEILPRKKGGRPKGRKNGAKTN